MTTVFELDASFIKSQDIPLDVDDLRDGFERGFIKESAVVDVAVEEFRCGNSTPAIVALASLLRDQLDQVPYILSAFDDPQRTVGPQSARKWLYLELCAAFESRMSLTDPFEAVEQIYSDFDYPPTVAPFVRYMPAPPGATVGEEGMMERWKQFLDTEHAVLRRRPTDET